jgi:hypothetical protein
LANQRDIGIDTDQDSPHPITGGADGIDTYREIGIDTDQDSPHPITGGADGIDTYQEIPATDTAELESTEHVTPPDSAEGGW